MNRVNNPRFPHTCRILRKTVASPLDDEGDFSPLDVDAVQQEASGADVTVIYEGACRGYEKHTTSDRGEIITSYRGLSLPVTQNEWTKRGSVPREGDEIALDRGCYREYGRVIDVNPSNFHGTHITWRYDRN